MIGSTKQIKISCITEDEKNALEIVHTFLKELTLVPEYIVDGDGRSVADLFDDAFGDFDVIEDIANVLEIFLEADYLEEQ